MSENNERLNSIIVWWKPSVEILQNEGGEDILMCRRNVLDSQGRPSHEYFNNEIPLPKEIAENQLLTEAFTFFLKSGIFTPEGINQLIHEYSLQEVTNCPKTLREFFELISTKDQVDLLNFDGILTTGFISFIKGDSSISWNFIDFIDDLHKAHESLFVENLNVFRDLYDSKFKIYNLVRVFVKDITHYVEEDEKHILASEFANVNIGFIEELISKIALLGSIFNTNLITNLSGYTQLLIKQEFISALELSAGSSISLIDAPSNKILSDHRFGNGVVSNSVSFVGNKESLHQSISRKRTIQTKSGEIVEFLGGCPVAIVSNRVVENKY